MTVKFTDCRIEVCGQDGMWFCLLLDKQDVAEARRFIINRRDRVYAAELKEYREKRSLDANAMYWKLTGELAQAIGSVPEDVYRRHIKDIGNYETLCIQKEALHSFSRTWSSGHLGRFVETRESKLPGYVTVLAYYGSSDFDKQQMSMLIDNCIQDCQAAGIETLPADKVALLKEEWETNVTC